MIAVSRFDGSQFYVNCDLIEVIEANPDTVVTLTTQKKFVVRESPEEIIHLIVEYRRQTFGQLPTIRNGNDRGR